MVSLTFKHCCVDLIWGIGAHIPDLSSVDGFFDVIYLGIFIILSTAFDSRFYGSKPPTNIEKEVYQASLHFRSLLRIFSRRYSILLEGKAMSVTYVVDRMLGEFSAAAVVFAKSIHETQDEGFDDGDGRNGVTTSMFTGRIDNILQRSYPEIFPYFSRCVDRCHKFFLWNGPEVQILRRSEEVNTSLSELASFDELLDLPSQELYPSSPDPTLSTSIPPPGKHRDRGDSKDDELTKRCRI